MNLSDLFGCSVNPQCASSAVPVVDFSMLGVGFLIGLVVGAMIVVGLFAAFCEK